MLKEKTSRGTLEIIKKEGDYYIKWVASSKDFPLDSLLFDFDRVVCESGPFYTLEIAEGIMLKTIEGWKKRDGLA